MVEQWQKNMFDDSYEFSIPLKKVKGLRPDTVNGLVKDLNTIDSLTANSVVFSTKTGYLIGSVTVNGPLNNDIKSNVIKIVSDYHKRLISKKFYKANDEGVLIPLRGEMSDFEKYLMSLTLIKHLRTEISNLKEIASDIDFYKLENRRLKVELSVYKGVDKKTEQLKPTDKFRRKELKRNFLNKQNSLIGSLIFFNLRNKQASGYITQIHDNYVCVDYRGNKRHKVQYNDIKLNQCF